MTTATHGGQSDHWPCWHFCTQVASGLEALPTRQRWMHCSDVVGSIRQFVMASPYAFLSRKLTATSHACHGPPSVVEEGLVS